MEQQGDNGRGGGDMNKHQHQDLEMQQGDGQVQVQVQPQQPQQQPQPQKCPRCESLNTKFCYYNNYSLSQPRYFCKTCRRYWTQGGTLRNVPVGGGCRKGKRAKNSSFSTDNYSSSRSMQPQPQPQPSPQEVVVQTQPNLTTVVRAKDPSSAVASPSPAVAPSISPFYQGGGGYLSSLAAIHSLNPSQSQSQSHPFDQSLKVGVDVVGSSSNLGLLSGFNLRQIRPSQFYQMGSREREVESLYTPEQGLIPSSMDHMANRSAVSHCDWSQSFISNANNRASDTSMWSTISTTSISSNTERNTTAGSSSLIPNQWPYLPGYGPPP